MSLFKKQYGVSFPSVTLILTLISGLSLAQSHLDILPQVESKISNEATAMVLAKPHPESSWESSLTGTLKDPQGAPISEASILVRRESHWIERIESNREGQFTLNHVPPDAELIIKKPGFRVLIVEPQEGHDLELVLRAQSVNGIYVATSFVQRENAVYKQALKLLQTTELNALVLDVKADDGSIRTDLKSMVDHLHSLGIYAIARIVSFKDNLGVHKHPELALKSGKTGKPWKDASGMTYLNPFNTNAWDYILNVAQQAVDDGFDEIEFDYVRFPTDRNRSQVSWSTPSFDSKSRDQAISGFLAKAQSQLGSQGVFIAADVFGITAFDSSDSGIGQRVENVTQNIDYVCPMVYPSGFALNSDGIHGSPDDYPEKIVQDTLRRYRNRANPNAVLRPWLQAFRDYSYDHIVYGAEQIRDQIEGSKASKGYGFLLWNAGSQYTGGGLNSKE